jgi:pimeloyl-ACP methyl ester carboxylesterase
MCGSIDFVSVARGGGRGWGGCADNRGAGGGAGGLDGAIAGSAGSGPGGVCAGVLRECDAGGVDHVIGGAAMGGPCGGGVVFELPGYGGSSGKARLKSIGPAALASFDVLAREAGGKPIIVAGHSIGTTAAIYVARERPVAGVFLHNPPPLKQLILGKFGWWNLWLGAAPIALQVPGELDSIENAKHVKAPAVFVLAEADSLVPGKYQRRVTDAYAGEVRVLDLKGAEHNDPPEEIAPEELKAAVDWLWGKAMGTGWKTVSR